VVVDRSRLDPAAAQLPPFEVVGGTRAPDLRTSNRRFFQYQYDVRVISDSLFGRDVQRPPLAITYRIRRTGPGQQAAVEGAAAQYALPPVAVRILSLVSSTAFDIRDATADTFFLLDEDRFRADTLITIGRVLALLGLGLGVLGLVRTAVTRRGAALPRGRRLSVAAVVRGVDRELVAIRRARERAGWSPELLTRALAALRILAACALGRTVSQAPPEFPAPAPDGTMEIAAPGLRPFRAVVSGAVTPQSVAALIARPSPPSSADGGRLASLHAALAAFTRSQYGRGSAEAAALDEPFAAAQQIARRLAFETGGIGRLVTALTRRTPGGRR
jgi:hypothetical protein